MITLTDKEEAVLQQFAETIFRIIGTAQGRAAQSEIIIHEFAQKYKSNIENLIPQKTDFTVNQKQKEINCMTATAKLKKIKNISYRVRKDGLIELRFYRDNICRSVYGRTQEEAIDKFQNWKPKTKKKPVKTSSGLTFQEWYNNWLELFKIGKISERTLKTLKYTFEKHVLKKLGQIKIKYITTEDIQKVINNLDNLKRQQTITYTLIKDCLNKAVQTNKIKFNPCEHVTIKRVTTINKGRALTLNEQNSLVKYLNDNPSELNNLYLFYLKSGLRREEATFINGITDVDREQNCLHVKGTKTKGSDRLLFLPKETINLIAQKEKPFNYEINFISRAFKEICNTLKFKDLKLHSLRHTFATRSLENGVPMEVVQKMLGHSTYKLTADTYTHVQTETLKRHIDKLKF